MRQRSACRLNLATAGLAAHGLGTARRGASRQGKAKDNWRSRAGSATRAVVCGGSSERKASETARFDFAYPASYAICGPAQRGAKLCPAVVAGIAVPAGWGKAQASQARKLRMVTVAAELAPPGSNPATAWLGTR
jgi:hypothetical protein